MSFQLPQPGPLALLIISTRMALVFRSLRIGILSMIPNIIPVSMTLGIMG